MSYCYYIILLCLRYIDVWLIPPPPPQKKYIYADSSPLTSTYDVYKLYSFNRLCTS